MPTNYLSVTQIGEMKKLNENKIKAIVKQTINEAVKRILAEKQTDWGGYYSDNPVGYNSWQPSTPEDAMNASKAGGRTASDIYRGVQKAMPTYTEREKEELGLQGHGDANLTNRRELSRKQQLWTGDSSSPTERGYDAETYYMDHGYYPYNLKDHAGYVDQEAPANHAERQRELQQTFNANSRKLDRLNRRVGVNESVISRIILESINKTLRNNGRQ